MYVYITLKDFFLNLAFNGMARLQITKIIGGFLRNNEMK